MGAGYLPRLAGFLLALSVTARAAPPRPKGPPPSAGQAAPAASRGGKGRPSTTPAEAPTATPAPHDAPEKSVQGQPKGGTATSTTNAVQTEESKEGVKTYKFGAVEVESRLKSPELIYFMRRVRAEFGATDLGHRSFMPELRTTERLPTFR